MATLAVYAVYDGWLCWLAILALLAGYVLYAGTICWHVILASCVIYAGRLCWFCWLPMLAMLHVSDGYAGWLVMLNGWLWCLAGYVGYTSCLAMQVIISGCLRWLCCTAMLDTLSGYAGYAGLLCWIDMLPG